MMAEERIVKKKRRFLWGLAFGLISGFILAQLMPIWWERYLPDSLRTGRLVEGEVLDKGEQPDQLLLKISTPDGVLLATFTEKVDEIGLLVETGDNIALRVQSYQPFLDDPYIERVRKPGKSAEAEPEEDEAADFQQLMERKLNELEPKIAELEKAFDEVRSESEPETLDLMERLRAKRDVARQKLSELEQSSGAACEDLKKGMEGAWQELEEAFDSAASRMKTEESPQP